jgi:hypothetical protein
MILTNTLMKDEAASSFLCTAKTMPLYQGLVLLLMNDWRVSRAGNFVRFRPLQTTKLLASSSKGNTVGAFEADFRTYANGRTERAPVAAQTRCFFHGRAVVITINPPPHHFTDKVPLHNFLSSFSGAKFRRPKIGVSGTRSPVLRFAAGQEKGRQRWQGQGHRERASMRTHWYGFYAAQVSPTCASVNQSITV